MKKIAIVVQFIKEFTGSEIMVYDFSKTLKSMGHDVTVLTLQKSQPLLSEFHKIDIPVFTHEEQPLQSEFDLAILFHNNTAEIFKNHKLKIHSAVYFSLSPYEESEQVYNHMLLLNNIYANSYETKNKVEKSLKTSERWGGVRVFPNSVTKSFFNSSYTPSCNLKKVAFVSNHFYSNLDKVREEFKKHNIDITFFGYKLLRDLESKDKEYSLITEDTLKEFDLVVTIGRTVQYCFALGIPVYCYGRFGGDGFITQDNFDDNYRFNFSGRKNAKDLEKITNIFPYKEVVKDCVDNFSKSLESLSFLKFKANEMFNLEKNLKKLLEENKEKIQWNQFEEKFIEFTPKVIKAPNDTYFHNKKRLKRHLRRLAIAVLFVVALMYLI